MTWPGPAFDPDPAMAEVSRLRRRVVELEETNDALRQAVREARDGHRKAMRLAVDYRRKLDYIEQTKPR